LTALESSATLYQSQTKGVNMHTHQLQIVDADGDTITFCFDNDSKQIEVVSSCDDLEASVVTYINRKEIKALQSFLDMFNTHIYRLESFDGDDL